MNPPRMAGWNLALRFALELAALAALGAAAWTVAPGFWRWIAVGAVPLLAAAAWGTFNVVDDPSRSGEAPVEVAGAIRLTIELAILAAGVVALVVAGRREPAGLIAVLVVFHYVMSWSRIQWLLTT